MKHCEGNCDEHRGDVKCFQVIDGKDNYDWGFYFYCEKAVEEDLRRGFKLEELELKE